MPITVEAWASPAPVVDSLIDPDTPAGQQPVGVSGRTLVMSEEFNGALIDTDANLGYVKCRQGGPEWSCWYPDWPMFASDDPVNQNHTNTDVNGYYQRNRVSTAAGSLVLDAVLDYPAGTGLDYSLGTLQSLPGLTLPAGRFIETRVKMSAMPSGIWPAAWLSSSDYNTWPPEIDYFEAGPGLNGPGINGNNVYNPGDAAYRATVSGIDFTQWHTYACDWKANAVTFWFDGVQQTTTTRTLGTDQYLIFDIATQAGAAFAAESMQVDYIRVWQ